MKYYYGNNIDKQGRVALGELIAPKTQVVIWVEDPDYNCIHIRPYIEGENVPSCSIRRTDDKSRVILPKEFRRNAINAVVGVNECEGGVVVKLLYD